MEQFTFVSMNKSKTVTVKHATSTWWRQIRRHWVEMSSNTEPALIAIGPQPGSGPEKSVITANPSQASPAWRRAQTFSPFALLMALRGLRTLRTLRIFTTEMALDLGEGREQSVLQVDKTLADSFTWLSLYYPHTRGGGPRGAELASPQDSDACAFSFRATPTGTPRGPDSGPQLTLAETRLRNLLCSHWMYTRGTCGL